MKNVQKLKISVFGAVAALFGFASMILSFFNYNFKVLNWIDNWGENMGWAIRIELIVIGLAVYFVMSEPETKEVLIESKVE
jgi:hypothetical protein